MADTHGFEMIIQSGESVIKKAIKGAWKSANCPDQSNNDGRIPEFMDIPATGDIGGYNILDGQVQIPQAELDAKFEPSVNGVELIMGLNTQIEIDSPPTPLAQFLDFHAVIHAKVPIGTLPSPNSQDVGILLANMTRSNVWAVLGAHPLDGVLGELVQDYVHKAYEDLQIPHVVVANGVSMGPCSCNSTTQVLDNQAVPAHTITTSFPNATTLRVSIPIYLRMYSFAGPITLLAPMGIETRINIHVPFDKLPDKYVARFGDVVLSDVTIDPIAGAGTIASVLVEPANYIANKGTLAALSVNLDDLISAQLQAKGVDFAHGLGNRTLGIPSKTDIETKMADIFFDELVLRGHLALWSPKATNATFMVDDVTVKVFSNSLNIALNNTGSGNANAITYFIPSGMEFSIAMSRPTLEEKIEQARDEQDFQNSDLPKRFNEGGKDVDLNSLNISVIDNCIHLTGTLTVIDAVLGCIDVDASFTVDVGLHWDPNGSLNAAGGQLPVHHIIGDPDIDIEEGIAFWIIAIILTIISFGAGGVLIGVIVLILVLIVHALIEKIGTDAFINGLTGAVDGIAAWPTTLANVGRVKAIFWDPIDISSTGLVMSGTLEVLSSCEATQVVPATTAGRYTTNAMQSTPLLALNTYSMANFRWNPGDGSSTQLLQNIHHYYESSGIYLAKHGVDVTEYGGASSRHFALVRVQNVPPTVNAGPDITVYEGQVVTLTASFEDVEYMDTHWSIWNFGDDRPLEIVAVSETNQPPKAVGTTTVTHAWCDDGIYDVSVQVIDNNGGIGIDTIRVTVLNVAPTVVTPEHMFAYHCSPVTLVANFTDPGWCDTHTATWRFGDCSDAKMGLVVETNLPPAARGTVTAAHCYKSCGSYVAECTVMDDDGGIGKSSTIVDVICLHNGDFNQGFSYRSAGKVADFWTSFFVSAKGPNAAVPNHGEVFFCEKCIVYDGLSSQRIVAPRDGFAGIYQQLGANLNWTYQIDVMYMLKNASGKVKLGIDPYGQTDPFSDRIVWSQGNTEGAWSNLLQRVCAKADQITIFLGLEALEASEVCFDVTKLVVQQNISCSSVPVIPSEPTPKCTDFTGLTPNEVLPADWTHDGVTYQTLSGVPNRLVDTYPSEFAPTLQLGNSMTLAFENPVEDLKLNVAYMEGVTVNYVANDHAGVVVSQGEAQLSHPQGLIEVQGANISTVQLGVTGAAALSRLCYKERLTPINNNQ